jgi:small-conductance mechanosensitive channel/CRP-like cAMP-binding protein
MISSDALWAIVVIVVVPVAVLAAAELDERLRQRDSALRTAVGVLRSWVLPIFAAWIVLVPVLGVEADQWYVRFVASALVVATAVATLALLRTVLAGIVTRRRVAGRGSVPQLLLALPRLALLLAVVWMLLRVIWGVDLSAALTALGVTSLIVSFALQDTLSGLASGFLLLSDQPFQPGDWITTGSTEGLVVDINWRTTRLRTRDGDLLIVPNSTLAKADIVNRSAPTTLHRVVVRLQVAYANPPTLAKQMLLAAARQTTGVLADPPPAVRVVEIDDPLMGYEVDLWVDDFTVVPRVRSEFGSLVWYQSHRMGVPLPSPAQDLYLHDAAAVAAAAVPKPATIRAGLQRSPLLAMLGDAEIDGLVSSSRPARYAAGELMVDSASAARDLIVMVAGRAVLVLIEPGHDEAIVGDLGAGETIGILDDPRGDGRILAVRAVTDCEVVVVDAAAASDVASRHTELAAAFNRLRQIRARRVERLLAGRLDPLPPATPDHADDGADHTEAGTRGDAP